MFSYPTVNLQITEYFDFFMKQINFKLIKKNTYKVSIYSI